jgi:hypothetical protein
MGLLVAGLRALSSGAVFMGSATLRVLFRISIARDLPISRMLRVSLVTVGWVWVCCSFAGGLVLGRNETPLLVVGCLVCSAMAFRSFVLCTNRKASPGRGRKLDVVVS